jgi:hypothetical protein
MFLTGVTDCVQEALRFLTEVERLPANHPSVVKLNLHLYQQYQVFQIQNILNTSLCISSDVENDERSRENENVHENDSNTSCHQSTQGNSNINGPLQK